MWLFLPKIQSLCWVLTLTSLLRCASCQRCTYPVICSDTGKYNLVQEEVEKRRHRAQKFGTDLVENGLQPALTSKQAKEAKQSAVHISAAATPANAELTDAGVQNHHAYLTLYHSQYTQLRIC